MAESQIEWTEATWNPLRGCSRISRGCGLPGAKFGCYAETIAARFSRPGLPFHGFARMTKAGPRWTGKIALIPEKLDEPIRWREPRRIFVNSMSDLFHERVKLEMVQAVFDVIWKAERHTYQILTKRAQRMMELMRQVRFPSGALWMGHPEPNVWLGVSVEDQAAAELRVPYLLDTPTAVRFLSVEPLYERVRLSKWLAKGPEGPGRAPGINWVIVGCQSGHSAAPMDLDWARDIRDQCQEAGVAFFLKQAVVNGRVESLPMLDGRRWAEYPAVVAA